MKQVFGDGKEDSHTNLRHPILPHEEHPLALLIIKKAHESCTRSLDQILSMFLDSTGKIIDGNDLDSVVRRTIFLTTTTTPEVSSHEVNLSLEAT